MASGDSYSHPPTRANEMATRIDTPVHRRAAIPISSDIWPPLKRIWNQMTYVTLRRLGPVGIPSSLPACRTGPTDPPGAFPPVTTEALRRRLVFQNFEPPSSPNLR